MTLVALVVALASVSTDGGMAPPITTETRAAIRVHLDTPAPTARETLDEARRLTSSALAWAGIRVEWVACANDRREADCPVMSGPADVTLRVEESFADVPDIVERGWPRRMCDARDGVAMLPVGTLLAQARGRRLDYF